MPGHQARARRPDPGRRAGRAVGDGGRRVRRAWRSPRPACARACSSASCSQHRDPPLFDDVRARVGPQPRRPVPARTTRTPSTSRELALTMWDALGQRRPGRARAAVGRGDAARHRHVDRLRRPPQALALPDPQRRPAGLLAARDRADRPDGALPPQGQPDARASSRALGARRRRGAARRAARPCCGWPSSSSARATRRSTACACEVARRPRRAAAGGARGRRDRPLGRAARGATCSSRRSGASSRSARAAGRSAGETVTSSRSDTASTTSSSASSLPPPGSASQVTRIMPVATFSSPTTIRPQMTSPSSQPIRSRSNHDRCTRLAVPPHGQLLSWASLALQTACMFLAEASRLLTRPRYPGVPSSLQ